MNTHHWVKDIYNGIKDIHNGIKDIHNCIMDIHIESCVPMIKEIQLLISTGYL